MTDNRRNYYRILHVQPEAPLEIIRASYRTLMSTLRHHPDLGGDHAQAALLNEAWGVLSDPERRAAYDRGLRARIQAAREEPVDPADHAAKVAEAIRAHQAAQARQRAGASSARAAPPPASSASSASKAQAQAQAQPPRPAPRPRPPGACAVCEAVSPGPLRLDSRCVRCSAPLAGLPSADAAPRELFGRRSSARRDRSQEARMAVGWPASVVPVRWRDVSLTGLSVWAAEPLPVGQVVRITDPALDVVAEIVSARRSGAAWTLHARLRSAIFTQTAGVFVSTRA